MAQLRAWAAAIGVAPNDVLFVGDALRDAAIARAAGVRFVGLSRPGCPDTFAGSGVPVVTSPTDLARLVACARRSPVTVTIPAGVVGPSAPEPFSSPRARAVRGGRPRWPAPAGARRRHPQFADSVSSYAPPNKPVLRRHLEPGQYPSIRYTERLAAEQAVTSVGSKGDSYDNTMAESINSLDEGECIRREGPWRTVDDVELATLSWVHWWNTQRILEPIGDIPTRGVRSRVLARP